MDEQLLKKTVQSIELPEDMRDRIIEKCRSGEAKPLILPKKRFLYMPTAVTACVCILAAALAGVGVWQLKVLSDNGSEPPATVSDGIGIEPEDCLINFIPISDDDLNTANDAYKDGYGGKQHSSYDDFVELTEQEINEYFGIDTAYLLYDLNIKLTPINGSEADGRTCPYVFRADGGIGEIYFDTNCFTYGENGEISIYISKFAVPHSIPKLWSDSEQLSTIGEVTAAVGKRDGDGYFHGQYRTEFKLEQYGLYFNVWCDPDMISKVVSAIYAQCCRQFSKDDQPVPVGESLTLDKLLEICKGDPSHLSWSDFAPFTATDIGSGLYVLQYDIEGRYTLLIGGVPEEEPYYMIFSCLTGSEEGIDIREGGLEDYLALHTDIGTTAPLVPLTLDKLKEICSGDPSKLSWSDFQQFESTAFGSGLLYLEYDIDGKYTLTVGGVPDMEPYIMELHAAGQYYAIDIREDSIDEYLSQPIPEGNVINVIPITREDIEKGKYTADVDFAEGDQVYLTDRQLSEYYGIDITSFGGMPNGFRATQDGGLRQVLADRDSGGTVYYDINSFTYTAPDRTGIITVSVATLPDHIDKLGEDPKMRSRIGGRIVSIGLTEDGHYEVELLSADSVLAIGVSAEGVTLEELCDVIAALVEQTEEREFVNEDYPYPWLYIDSIADTVDN